MEIRFLIPAILAALSILLTSCGRNSAPDSVSGTIETDEARVASRYGGRVENILAQEGDALKPRQSIVELDAAELRAQRDQAAAELAELEAGPRPEEIAAAKAEWEVQVAELEFARTNADRAEALFARGTVSVTERDEAVKCSHTLERSVAAARSRYDLLLAGTRPERIARARAQLAQIETQLKEMKIVAPTNCVLEVLSVKIGDVLAPNQQVATLLLTNHIWVRVFVPESWLRHIQLGDVVKVHIDGKPPKDFSGVVEQINRQAEFTPRNVQTVEERIKQVFGVKVRLDSSNDELHAGASADVVFPNVPK